MTLQTPLFLYKSEYASYLHGFFNVTGLSSSLSEDNICMHYKAFFFSFL